MFCNYNTALTTGAQTPTRILKPAEGHVLDVERHRLQIHIREARVLHHLCLDAIAMHSRLEYDPRKKHCFAAFELDHVRKRHSHLYVQLVADVFPELEVSVLPHLTPTGLLRDAAVSIDIALRHCQNKSIDVVDDLVTSQAPWRFMRGVTLLLFAMLFLPSFKPFCNSKNTTVPCSNSLPTIPDLSQIIVISAFLPKLHRADRANH